MLPRFFPRRSGANLVIVTGRGKGGHQSYGCPQNFYRGACVNRLKARADWLGDQLLSQLQRAVLEPEVLNYALNEFERQLAASFSVMSNQIDRMRQRSELIQQELRNLVSTVASCGKARSTLFAFFRQPDCSKNQKSELRR
jgi:hypothetical protein